MAGLGQQALTGKAGGGAQWNEWEPVDLPGGIGLRVRCGYDDHWLGLTQDGRTEVTTVPYIWPDAVTARNALAGHRQDIEEQVEKLSH